ncbi:cytochrome P450 [Streptomyces chrestomyceticus]|uniref:cytochrome P450 n=1 Tax=Streptomyces chrestomyceticus TaxID=68185 RepID=UPI0033F0CA44
MDTHPEPIDYPFSEPSGLTVDPEYEQCRGRPGLTWVRPPYGDNAWLVTRYADIRFVLRDRRFVRTPPPGSDEARLTPLPLRDSILNTDPPQQPRLRKALAQGLMFNAEHVRELEELAQREARRLLARCTAQPPPADLAAAYTKPLTVAILCPLIGIPEEDLAVFLDWFEGFAGTGLPTDVVAERIEEISGYTARLIADRRERPRDDLVSRLVARLGQDDGLSMEELGELVNDILLAVDNVTTQLTNACYVLLSSPSHFRELTADPELLPRAADELLRYAPFPSHVTFARYATENVEVGGTLVRAGEQVLPALPAGNHDPRMFADPERLDFHRGGNPHLSFGHGTHHCMGPPLVRMLVKVAVAALLDHPGLRPAAASEELPWRADLIIRRIESLPVTW